MYWINASPSSPNNSSNIDSCLIMHQMVTHLIDEHFFYTDLLLWLWYVISFLPSKTRVNPKYSSLLNCRCRHHDHKLALIDSLQGVSKHHEDSCFKKKIRDLEENGDWNLLPFEADDTLIMDGIIDLDREVSLALNIKC
ncbi:hypothetical protein Hdeb2414_s0003g00116321 [Helianthus debilis subsp. tardiflorus]